MSKKKERKRGRRGNNEGSIYPTGDGRWRGALTLGWRNGKPQRKFYNGATRGEVQEKLTRALRDQQQGLPIVGERQTVGDFMKHWLEQVAANKVRPSTLESYRWITEKHIVPNLGRVPLAKLSPQQIQVFLNDRLKSGRQPLPKRLKEGKEPPLPQPPSNPALTPRTVQHIHATLRTALDQALRWNLVGRNAATLVDAPRVRQTEVQPYTPEEANSTVS